MTSPEKNTSVLLIGASRGLGYAIAAEYIGRGSRVTATVRGTSRTPLHELQESNAEILEIENIDINEPSQIAALHERLKDRTFDLLFVNAGIAHPLEETIADISTDDFNHIMTTNALSPLRVVEVLGDLITADGTIAIMSSGQGSVSNNDRGGFEIYRASKSALNQLMRSYAARHLDDKRTLLLLAPGWVKTDLGGPNASLTIEESIPNLLNVIDAQIGHGGLQYLDYLGRTVAW